MTLLEINIPLGLASLAFAWSIAALLYNYGGQMIRERMKSGHSKEHITSKDVHSYIEEQGYSALYVTPELNTTDWTVFLVKEGDLYIVKVFVDNGEILGSEYTLA